MPKSDSISQVSPSTDKPYFIVNSGRAKSTTRPRLSTPRPAGEKFLFVGGDEDQNIRMYKWDASDREYKFVQSWDLPTSST